MMQVSYINTGICVKNSRKQAAGYRCACKISRKYWSGNWKESERKSRGRNGLAGLCRFYYTCSFFPAPYSLKYDLKGLFKELMIFALAEDLPIYWKNADVLEISEINKDSDFYNTIMKVRLFAAWNGNTRTGTSYGWWAVRPIIYRLPEGISLRPVMSLS